MSYIQHIVSLTRAGKKLHFQKYDSQEILLIIDSLDNNKSSGPNSIPTDVLKLIKNNTCHPKKSLIYHFQLVYIPHN